MKKLIIFLIAILAISCTKEELIQPELITPEVEIISATCQKFYGMRVETGEGSGTLYEIVFKSDSKATELDLNNVLYELDIRKKVTGTDTVLVASKRILETVEVWTAGKLMFGNYPIDIKFIEIPNVYYP